MIAQHKMEQRSSGVQKGYEASYLRVLTPDSHESSAGLKPACCCIEQQKKIHVSRLGAISHLVFNCYDLQQNVKPIVMTFGFKGNRPVS